jgi:hypothetical protein
MRPSSKPRPRASAELIAALRAGKAELRREREKLDLPEKVRLVLELQRLYWPLLQRRRRPADWESPWPITP